MQTADELFKELGYDEKCADVINAIEHILSDYKRVLKENEELKNKKEKTETKNRTGHPKTTDPFFYFRKINRCILSLSDGISCFPGKGRRQKRPEAVLRFLHPRQDGRPPPLFGRKCAG